MCFYANFIEQLFGSTRLLDISRNAIPNQCRRAIACIILAEYVCGCCANTPTKFIRIICPKRTNCRRRNAVQIPANPAMLKPVRNLIYAARKTGARATKRFLLLCVPVVSDVSGTVSSMIRQRQQMKQMMSSSLEVISSSTNQKRSPGENLQLAESVGDVRALLIDILCDEIALNIDNEGFEFTMSILDECHTTFLSCFNAFYPTNLLKWNCLCDLLMKRDKVGNKILLFGLGG